MCWEGRGSLPGSDMCLLTAGCKAWGHKAQARCFMVSWRLLGLGVDIKAVVILFSYLMSVRSAGGGNIK
jgi:hypothetical protein